MVEQVFVILCQAYYTFPLDFFFSKSVLFTFLLVFCAMSCLFLSVSQSNSHTHRYLQFTIIVIKTLHHNIPPAYLLYWQDVILMALHVHWHRYLLLRDELLSKKPWCFDIIRIVLRNVLTALQKLRMIQEM